LYGIKSGSATDFPKNCPGDEEYLAGKPFVGPAGRLLENGITGAGIGCSIACIINVVKHFKWTPRALIGKDFHTRVHSSSICAHRMKNRGMLKKDNL
jgi:uracil-DNA glycosylase family 4